MGKLMSSILKVLIFIAIFAFLTSLIVTVIREFIDDYDILDAEYRAAVVTEKISVNNMTGLPKYYVIVDLNENDRNELLKNRVFAWKFKRLEIGDQINGHHIHGTHFMTTLDIITDSVLIILSIIVMLFIWLGMLLTPVFIYMDKKEEKKTYTQKRKEKRKKATVKRKKGKKEDPPFLKRVLPEKLYRYVEYVTFQGVFVSIVLGISVILAGGFMLNGLYKLSPVGKTKTTAYVVDTDAQSEIYYYIGEYSDPYFTLELVFEDKRGQEYRVIKEVTRSVYRKHDIGSPIEISYSTLNPYNVFVRDYSIRNLMEIFAYAKFMYFSFITSAGVLALCIHYFSWRKKRKEKVSG